jgi:hypothetical protein
VIECYCSALKLINLRCYLLLLPRYQRLCIVVFVDVIETYLYFTLASSFFLFFSPLFLLLLLVQVYNTEASKYIIHYNSAFYISQIHKLIH